jgi:tetratricopeptide (TPR) repeat protein
MTTRRIDARPQFRLVAGVAFALVLGLGLSQGCLPVPLRQKADAGGMSPVTRSKGTKVAYLPRSEAHVDLSVIPASHVAGKPTDEQEINLHLDLGRGLESQGELEKAQLEYRRAVAKVTASTGRKASPAVAARLHRRLGSAYERLGQTKQALAQYQLAKKLAPRDAMVWNDAGYGAYQRGDWPAAESDLRKAAALDPTNPLILNNLGLTLAARGHSEEALTLLERASGPAAAHLNLGYVLAASGETESARKQFEQAVRIDPSLARAKQALAQLSKLPAPDPELKQASAKTSEQGTSRKTGRKGRWFRPAGGDGTSAE